MSGEQSMTLKRQGEWCKTITQNSKANEQHDDLKKKRAQERQMSCLPMAAVPWPEESLSIKSSNK